MTAVSPPAALADRALPSAPALTDVDLDALVARGLADLEQARRWPRAVDTDGLEVATGRLAGVPVAAYHSRIVLPASAEAVVRFLADDTFEELPRWSAEFDHGEVLATLEVGREGDAAWLLRASYRTPPPLSNREYVYYFARRRLDAERTAIVYRSVASELAVQAGYVRAVLYPTVHLVTALDAASARVEHVLASDLGGWFPHAVQTHLLRGALVEAHVRDATAQRTILQRRAAEAPA